MKAKGFWIKQAIAVVALAASWQGAIPAAVAQAVGAQYVPIINVTAGKGTAAYAGDGGPATAASVNGPQTPTYDKYSNLFIADTKNNAIRRVDAVTGIITTVAGIGSAGFAGDGGPATAAQISGPVQVSFDTAGNMYVADTGNNRIREVMAVNGVVTSTCGCIINTIVGNGGKVAPTVGVAPTATAIYAPRAVVVDPAGDIFVAVGNSNQIIEVPFGGLTVKYAGAGGATLTGIGGPATAATFTVYFIALDATGNLYALDQTNNVLLSIAPASGSSPTTGITASGNITLFAGSLTNGATTGTVGYNGDGIPANTAQLNKPFGLAVDAAGNVYISDTVNFRIRKVSAATGLISTIAGNGKQGRTGAGGPALAASQNTVQIGISPNGAMLALSYSAANGVDTIFLPNSFPTTAVGSQSAAQTVAALAQTTGTVLTYGIGPGLPADFTVGAASGCPGAITAGSFCTAPVQFTPTAPGTRYSRMLLTDNQNDSYLFGMFGVGQAPSASFLSGLVTFSAGSAGTAGSSGDGGSAASALLNQPSAAALDVNGNLYVADAGNNKIRLVNPSTGATISTFAGTGAPGATGDGGSAASATLSNPLGVTLDAAGDLFIADTGNHRIREVNAQTGAISTVAGTGTSGSAGDGGQANAAQLNAPKGVVADGAGNLYIADTGNNKVRAVDVYLGTITTIAGTGTAGNGGSGVAGTTAALNAPQGVALDSAGNLFIADTGNHVIREVNLTTGVMTTVAGSGTAAYSGDGGSALSAALNAPTAVAVDAAGDLYIADTGNHVVRMVSAAGGTISTVVGTGVGGPETKNVSALATQMIAPAGLVLDSANNLYIVDPKSHVVVFVSGSQPTLAFGTINQGTTSAPQTATLMNNGNQNLVLGAITLSPSSYRQVTGNSTDCTASTTLAPGASCQFRVTFTPVMNGSTPGTVTIADNALNSATATQVINLSATAVVVGPPAAVAVKSGSGQTTTPLGVFPLVLQAVVSDTNGYFVNGATVTFTVAPASNGAGATFNNSSTVATAVTNSNGLAVSPGFSANTATGTYSILATVAGVTTPATFTETNAGKLSPKLGVSASASTLKYGQSVTLTATLTPSSAGSNAASGPITFLDNGVAVGTVNVASGVATLVYSPGAGTRQITASYSGDSNFASSITATAVTLSVAALPVTATVNSLSLPYGSTVPALSGTLTGVLPADQGNVALRLSVPNPPLAVGQYPITGTLTGSAAGNYTLTLPGTPTLTITQATTATTLSVNNPSPSLGAAVALTATVISTVSQAPAPTGTVTFYVGSTSLGTVTLSSGTNAATGTLTVSTLPAGAQQITAVYSGSTNNATSTSAALTVTVVAPNFTFDATPATVTVKQGDHSDIALSVVANQAFSGAVVFSCSGLPANSTCVFTQPTVTVGAGATGKALLQITTSGPSTSQVRLDAWPRGEGRTVLAAIFLPGLVLLGFGKKTRKLRLRRTLLPLVLLPMVMLVSAALSGCSSNLSPTNTVLTPTGTTTVTVTAQSTTITQSVTVTLNVTAQ